MMSSKDQRLSIDDSKKDHSNHSNVDLGILRTTQMTQGSSIVHNCDSNVDEAQINSRQRLMNSKMKTNAEMDPKNDSTSIDQSCIDNNEAELNLEDQLVTRLAEKYSISGIDSNSLQNMRKHLEHRIKDGKQRVNKSFYGSRDNKILTFHSERDFARDLNTKDDPFEGDTGSCMQSENYFKEYFALQEMEYYLLLTHTKDNPLDDAQIEIIATRIEELKKNLKNEEAIIKEISRLLAKSTDEENRKYLKKEKQKSMDILNNIKLNLDNFTRLSCYRMGSSKLSSTINSSSIDNLNILGSFFTIKYNYFIKLKRMVDILSSSNDGNKISHKKLSKELMRNFEICHLLRKSCAALQTKVDVFNGKSILKENNSDLNDESKYTKYSGEVSISLIKISIPLKKYQKNENNQVKKKNRQRVTDVFTRRKKNDCRAKFFIQNFHKSSVKLKLEKSLSNVKTHFSIENCDFIEMYIDSMSVPIALVFIKIEDAILLDGFSFKISLFPKGMAELKMNFEKIQIHHKIMNTGIFRRHRLRKKIDRTKIDNFFVDKEKPNILALSRFFLSSIDTANQDVINQYNLNENLSSDFQNYNDPVSLNISSDQQAINLDKKFSLVALLNKGYFGKLFLVKPTSYYFHKKNHEFFVIKSINKYSLISKDEVDNAFTEKKILQISNDFLYIVNIYDTYQDKYHLYFILEYCQGGDLITLLMKSPFTEQQILYYSAVALSCLDFLHNKSILYRDMKLDNICLQGNGTPRLVDFGLSKVDIKIGSYTNTFCGTYVYLPPEMFLGPQYTHTLDFWQLGSLIYTMKFRCNPFSADTDELLANEICYSELKFPGNDNPNLNNLIYLLMEKDPETRLGSIRTKGALGVKKHVYFSTINWMELSNKKIDPPFIPQINNDGLDNFPNYSKQKISSASHLDSVQQNILSGNEYLFEKF